MKAAFALLALLLLATRALAQDSDPCQDAHKDETSCNADTKTGGGCTWCKCGALPSACWTKTNAAKLPSGVYDCASSSFVVKEEHKGVPAAWRDEGAVDPATAVTLTVAIKHDEAGRATLESELLDRSDPDSPRFGQWLMRDEVDALLAPAPAAVAAVLDWLGDGAEASGAGDWATLTTTAAEAERLLGGKAEFHRYRHAVREDMTIIRLASSYRVPAHIDELVDFVGPTIRFPLVVKRPEAHQAAHQALRRRLLFGPFGASVTPSFLRKLYNATDAVAAPDTKNVQACASFLGQFYSPSDLKQFFSKYASDAKVTEPTVFGPNEASNPGTEAELDIQYIMGVGRDIPTQFWSTAGKQPGSPENEVRALFFCSSFFFSLRPGFCANDCWLPYDPPTPPPPPPTTTTPSQYARLRSHTLPLCLAFVFRGLFLFASPA